MTKCLLQWDSLFFSPDDQHGYSKLNPLTILTHTRLFMYLWGPELREYFSLSSLCQDQ